MPPTLPMINRNATKPVWLDETYPGSARAISEHRDNYTSHQLPKMLPDQKELPNIHQSSLPFESKSIHRIDYVDNSQPKPRNYRRGDEIKIPNVPLNAMSDYKSEYLAKKIEKTRSFKPDGLSFFLNGERSEDFNKEPLATSLYRQDFQRWSKKATVAANTSSSPPHQEIINGILPPPTSTESKEATLQGVTESRGNYRYPPQTRDFYPPPKWKQAKEPFTKETSYSKEFISFQTKPATTCKPLTCSLHPEGAFYQGVSTYKDDFIPQRPPTPQRNVYVNVNALLHNAGHTRSDWWVGNREAAENTKPYLEFTDQLFYHV